MRAGHALQTGAQFLDAEGFRDVIHSPHAGDFHGRFNGAVLRQDHHGDLGMQVVYEFEELYAAGAR